MGLGKEQDKNLKLEIQSNRRIFFQLLHNSITRRNNTSIGIANENIIDIFTKMTIFQVTIDFL